MSNYDIRGTKVPDVKVFPELSNKNSARSGGFEIHDPTVTLKKESVQEIVVETRKTHEFSESG